MALADGCETLLDGAGERGIIVTHHLARVLQGGPHRRRRRHALWQRGERVAIRARGVAWIAARLDQRALLQERGQVSRLERERPLDGLHLFLLPAERVQAGGEVGPQRWVGRIGRGRALEQFPRPGGVPPLHHAQAQLVQHRRVAGRELRHARQQLIGFAAAAGGARGLGGLDHSQDGGVVRDGGIDVAQEGPLWFLWFGRCDSSAGCEWRARWQRRARRSISG